MIGPSDMTPLTFTPDAHRRAVERRLRAGDYAQEVGRDLWSRIRACLRTATTENDGEMLKHYVRRLCYLCQNYNANTANDPFQGIGERA